MCLNVFDKVTVEQSFRYHIQSGLAMTEREECQTVKNVSAKVLSLLFLSIISSLQDEAQE